ncbi:MAG: hypothetical protein U9R74_09110 [Pseudomonadota bacterium]|nr:hypothetical protein [Pseudomonadota bacterium]
MSAANQNQARRRIMNLVGLSRPGARQATRAHVERAGIVAEEIWRRYRVDHADWQVKHLRWFLEHKTRALSPRTRYNYWLTIRITVAVLGRLDDWVPLLRGPWLRPNGDSRPLGRGRRPRLPGNAT